VPASRRAAPAPRAIPFRRSRPYAAGPWQASGSPGGRAGLPDLRRARPDLAGAVELVPCVAREARRRGRHRGHQQILGRGSAPASGRYQRKAMSRPEEAMASERDKMLAGELYDPLDAELARARERARDLCQDLNAILQEGSAFTAGQRQQLVEWLTQTPAATLEAKRAAG